jgi:hypothetical protein
MWGLALCPSLELLDATEDPGPQLSSIELPALARLRQCDDIVNCGITKGKIFAS